MTLPVKLRHILGVQGDDVLIAESTDEGVLLRPAAVMPVEMYSEDRVEEFAAAERDLSEWYEKRDQ